MRKEAQMGKGRKMETTECGMERCKPVSMSVFMIAFLVLILISWSQNLFLYGHWTGFLLSTTRILSTVYTNAHSTNIYPHATKTHPSATNTHPRNTITYPHATNTQPHDTNVPSYATNIQPHATNVPSHATNIPPSIRKDQAKATNIHTKSKNTHDASSTTTTTTAPSKSHPQRPSNSTAPSVTPAGSDAQCGEQYQEEGPMRRVVLWTPFWNSWDGWKGMIRDHGALRKGRCAMWRCEFLWGTELTTAELQEADSIIFFSLNALSQPLPPRFPHSLWIWLELESPVISKLATVTWRQLEASGVFFNLTMSYHHLNPIVALAGELVPLSTPRHCPISSTFYLDTSSPTYTSYSNHMHVFNSWLHENGVVVNERLRAERNRRHGGLIYEPKDNTTLTKPLPDDYGEEKAQGNKTSSMEEDNLTLTAEEIAFAARPRVAVWMASHCPTNSRREDLITALQGYMAVTTVGKCGTLKCGKNHMDDYCYRWLAASHLFYLSFENALCDDYVTEKLWTPMKHGMVPVVLGGPNYRHILPFDSYIDVANFSSVSALANHLLYLATHPAAYLRHLQWRRYWRVRRLVPWCDLCSVIHRQAHPVRANLDQWWNKTSTCHEPPPW